MQEYGEEGSESELREAATALHGFLDARAERNWAAACGYLSKGVVESFAQMAQAAERAAEAKGVPSSPKGCAAAMAALSGGLPDRELQRAAIADVGALRTEGDQAFLVYRGTPKGTIYAIQATKEAGAWKVASLNGIPLN